MVGVELALAGPFEQCPGALLPVNEKGPARLEPDVLAAEKVEVVARSLREPLDFLRNEQTF